MHYAATRKSSYDVRCDETVKLLFSYETLIQKIIDLLDRSKIDVSLHTSQFISPYTRSTQISEIRRLQFKKRKKRRKRNRS